MRKQQSKSHLEEVAKLAWIVRASSRTIGGTKVGCGVRTIDGKTFVGCNVEHHFRSHDIHAEVNAISTMIAQGGREIGMIVIAAEREFFTPCGSCMDWIMEFGRPTTIVAFQKEPGGELFTYEAGELMPYYPR